MEGDIFSYLILTGVFIFGFYVLFAFVPFGIWLTAQISGVSISLLELINMKICRLAPYAIVRAMILAAKADMEIDKDDLKAHSRVGGDVENVVKGMIAAKKNNKDLSFKKACELDLAHADLTEEL